jgi:hypothetical protein
MVYGAVHFASIAGPVSETQFDLDWNVIVGTLAFQVLVEIVISYRSVGIIAANPLE